MSNRDMVVCRLEVYSNYDCTNSGDTMGDSEYLRSVHRAVKGAVTEKAMMKEHANGAYGGALLCFAFRATRERFDELCAALKDGKSILIPKGTQFGFHSSFHGASSPFDETTRKNLAIAAIYGPSSYDAVGIVDDDDNDRGYSMRSVFGGTDFIRPADVRAA